MALPMYKKSQRFRFGSLLLQLSIFVSFGKAATGNADLSAILVCRKRTLAESVVDQNYQCLIPDLETRRSVDRIASRVVEINGIFVQTISRNSFNAYTAVLLYAQWCPFSEFVRPTFDALSIFFPEICHIAIEESALHASELSQYGVRSFPSLFLQNITTRIRYHGPKTVEALSLFYRNVTGVQPFRSGFSERSNVKQEVTVRLPKVAQNDSYVGRKSRSKMWLHDDMYLTLATLFLVLRIFHYFVPKVVSRARQCCIDRIHVLQAAKSLLLREIYWLVELEKFKNKGDKRRHKN